MKDEGAARTRSELPECGSYPHTALTSNPVTEKINISQSNNPDKLPPCGLWRRLASIVYDMLLTIALLMVAAAIVVVPSGAEIQPGTLWFQIYLMLVWWAYFAICWRVGGQTVGMRAWRVRLVTDGGERIGWAGTVLRFLIAGVSGAAAGLGYFWSLFETRRRGWHDMATGTRLVVVPKQNKKQR